MYFAQIYTNRQKRSPCENRYKFRLWSENVIDILNTHDEDNLIAKV